MTQLKIVVDYDLCEANGSCVLAAPHVFEIRDDDRMHVLLAQPPAAELESVEDAVRRCPKGAISLEEL